jgi:hypothetical protein
MKTLGTCRKDDRKTVAAASQTATCIIPSLPAGSRHTAIKANASSAAGGTIRVRTLPMGEAPQSSSSLPARQAGHDPAQRSRPDLCPAFSPSTASLSLRAKDSVPRLKAPDPHLKYKITEKQRNNFTT